MYSFDFIQKLHCPNMERYNNHDMYITVNRSEHLVDPKTLIIHCNFVRGYHAQTKSVSPISSTLCIHTSTSSNQSYHSSAYGE